MRSFLIVDGFEYARTAPEGVKRLCNGGRSDV